MQTPWNDTVLCRIKRKQDRDIAASESESIEARGIGDIIGDLTKPRTYSEPNSLIEMPSSSH